MFAVLVIPDFPLQAVLRILPAGGSRRAVAVMTGDPASAGSRQVGVLQCNAVAAAAGVAPGLTAPQAMARCPGIELHARSESAEASARDAALAAAWTLSPRVENTAPGVCTIDLRGHPAVAGPGRSEAGKIGVLARAAIACLDALGLAGRIGIARTPRIARYAADTSVVALRVSAGTPANSDETLSRRSRGGLHEGGSVPGARDPRRQVGLPSEALAKEGDLPYASAVRIIAPSDFDECAFLAPLPIELADPSEEQAAVLSGWGVKTLGGLTALPRAEAAMRLGEDGAALWDRAAGREWRVLRHAEPPRAFEAEVEFEDGIETLEPLLFLLRRFCDQLALQLAAANFAAAELHLVLKLDEGRHARDFRLPAPTGDAGVFFSVLHTHLETLKTDTPVVALRLAVTPTRPLHRQQGLFDSSLVDPHGLNETLARVGAVVGSERVGVPVLENTRRPDAVRLGPVPDRVSWQPELANVALHGLPLRRHRPPRPARVEVEDSRPVWVLADGVAGPVTAAEGPWRGSGEWWSAEAWSRDEWDVEIGGAGLHRIFESAGQWFVEGEYD
ncbi:MAG TPA: hypothetical protein VMM36_05310 [Opitutaceae bacterium]|nr:hypothetical protein [Opitutaceae bacterium]